MADYAIHDTTLIAQANIIRKKFGTNDRQNPADYPAKMNLMGALEEKTASGSVVTFADGADDVPLKSASFGIVASGGGGTPSTPVPIVGKSSVTAYHASKNLLAVGAQTDTINGVTFTVNSDGSVTVNGTASANTAFSICNVYLKAGSYILSGAPATGQSTTYEFQVLASNGNTYREYGNGRTFTLAQGTDGLNEVRILIRKNYVANNLVFYPQLELGSTATTFEPRKNTPITVALGQTVYGGTLANDGTLTITHALVPFSDCTWASVTSYQSNFNSTNGIVSLRFGKNAMASAGYAQKASTSLCNIFDNQGRSVWNNIDRMYEIGYTDGISFNVLYSDIGMSEWTSDATTIQNAFRASSLYSDGYITLELATPIVITGLDEINLSTYLGDNNIWCDSGDSEVVYRSSGTQTLIPPTLISKTITENGTYSAEDDGADGYDEVTVNVQGGAQNIETVLSSNPLIEVSGVSGTDVERTMWTYTASASGKIVFHANTQVKTNTGANDGYFTVKKNDTVIATTYANTSTTTSLPIPDIDIESGDVVTITCGFDNSHTSCWFDIYSTITILTENTPSLLMGGFGSSNSEEESTNSEEESTNSEEESTNSETENEELNEEAESEEE